jgi:hypothetical protein
LYPEKYFTNSDVEYPIQIKRVDPDTAIPTRFTDNDLYHYTGYFKVTSELEISEHCFEGIEDSVDKHLQEKEPPVK